MVERFNYDNDTNWDLVITRWLYKLSMKHPSIKDVYFANGFGLFCDTIRLYGDLSIDSTLSIEIKSLEAMMRDKPKRFIYYGSTPPSSYPKADGAPQKLSYYFNLFRKELRNETLDNLLDNESNDI